MTTTNKVDNTNNDCISFIYEIHDYLTDKKLLGTITVEEEELFQDIRSIIESFVEDKYFILFYEDKIQKYKEMLKELKKIENLLEMLKELKEKSMK